MKKAINPENPKITPDIGMISVQKQSGGQVIKVPLFHLVQDIGYSHITSQDIP